VRKARLFKRFLVGMAFVIGPGAAAQDVKPAENTIAVSSKLVTSAQPSREFLQTLEAQGFQVLVYLAPPTVPDAIADEPLIAARQGLVYVNIPISWTAPTRQDFESVSRVLDAYADRKVYVHCQANYRASSMVFLYRVIRLKEDPAKAWEALHKAWHPNATWRAFIRGTLDAYGVRFELL
jgi:protein tyrosine phosphatase (PTP) superfamily phosphohydrolase (DUF442 family)